MFFAFQLNTERTTLRRSPQNITSLLPEYDETKFNFNRVHADEILFECVDHMRHGSKQLTLSVLINNSPLTPYHCLLCPNLLENRPQVLTKEAILSACDILFGFADQKYHIGFNSPGAFASVNHLHLHLLYIETPLSIQNYVRKTLFLFKCSTNSTLFPPEQKTHHLIKNVHVVDESYPAHAYCFHIPSSDDTVRIVDDVYRLIEYFWLKIVPHNLFWTFGAVDGRQLLKIFIFPRMRMQDKMSASLNVAFCELSGYVVVGSKSKFTRAI